MKEAASDPDLMATDLVEYLVLKGVPFRDAHEAVADAVGLARESESKLSELTLAQFQGCCEKFELTLYEVFDPIKSAQSKVSPGGTAWADKLVEQLITATLCVYDR